MSSLVDEFFTYRLTDSQRSSNPQRTSGLSWLIHKCIRFGLRQFFFWHLNVVESVRPTLGLVKRKFEQTLFAVFRQTECTYVNMKLLVLSVSRVSASQSADDDNLVQISNKAVMVMDIVYNSSVTSSLSLCVHP